ncbi:MAG: sulfotransferase [Woeseiaceae bacterium]|nr:sulfotransferase [Woeseiaceae bacterium]
MIGLAARRFAALFVYACTRAFVDGRHFLGAVALILLFPLLLLWQAFHWIGFAVDEVLFRGYRRIEVRRPLFVLGPPRTGTTHLHRVLAADERTTTFSTWECLFGLSITGRYICLGLARLDRLLGRPVGRLASWLGGKMLGSMDDVHEFGISEPEEDFLCLMPVASCFILIVAFPGASWLWSTARLDRDLDERERRALLRFYRRAIQRHLYVFGKDKQYLSKNPSFSGMAEALLEEFPDARIIACSRDPVSTVPSQLSSLEPSLRLLGFKGVTTDLRDKLVDLLEFYYEHLNDVQSRYQGRIATIKNDELRNDLADSLARVYTEIGLDIDDAFAERLTTASTASRSFKSKHRYTLEDYGLDAAEIRTRFEPVWSPGQV